MMNIEFKKPTENDAKEIAAWKYAGIYSFYDNDKTEAKQQWALNIHNEENTFVMYNENNELIETAHLVMMMRTRNICLEYRCGRI